MRRVIDLMSLDSNSLIKNVSNESVVTSQNSRFVSPLWIGEEGDFDSSWHVPERHTFSSSLPLYRFAYINPQCCKVFNSMVTPLHYCIIEVAWILGANKT